MSAHWFNRSGSCLLIGLIGVLHVCSLVGCGSCLLIDLIGVVHVCSLV